jgi:drug/metabolite transporter (DMT)-like permease
MMLGYHLPEISTIIGTTLTGVIIYGITFTIFVTAIHRLGAIKAIAYFSTVPLIGALLSVLILKEPVTLNLILSAVFMSIGVWMHMAEKHEYEQAIYPI